ncbi:unnamed protein product, partial [Ilex paraguariensis]
IPSIGAACYTIHRCCLLHDPSVLLSPASIGAACYTINRCCSPLLQSVLPATRSIGAACYTIDRCCSPLLQSLLLRSVLLSTATRSIGAPLHCYTTDLVLLSTAALHCYTIGTVLQCYTPRLRVFATCTPLLLLD